MAELTLIDLRRAEAMRKRLMNELDKRCRGVAPRPGVTLLERYYDGDHPLPDPPRAMDQEAFAEAKQLFRALAKMGKTNWVRMIARAPAERLIVQGFRFGKATTPDDDARRLWQGNHLDADSQLLHDTVFSTGQGYGLVWPKVWPPEPGVLPDMTFEHPSEMIVAYAAGSRRRRIAALKRWTAEDGRIYATLYTPFWVFKWQTRSANPGYGLAMGDTNWDQRIGAADLDVPGGPWPLPNPLGEVSVVEFAINTGLRARPFGGGVAEFEPVLPIQDRINKTVFDRLVTGQSQAFRQRAVMGWEPPKDPETNLPDARASFRASQSALWTFADKDVKAFEFSQADFTHFIKGHESDVNAMAAITQTPPHYLLGAMVNISGDAMAAAESGHVSKVEAHAVVLGEPHEEFMRLGLKAYGSSSAEDEQLQVMWADIERRSWSMKIDGLVKLRSLNVPEEETWAMVPGVTAIDVTRWKELEAANPTDDGTSLLDRANIAATLFRAGFEPAACLEAAGLPTTLQHTGLLPITLKASVEGTVDEPEIDEATGEPAVP